MVWRLCLPKDSVYAQNLSTVCAHLGKGWRRVLFANLKEAGPMVALSAVTPPGQNELSYDESHCAQLGLRVHGKRYGCRIDEQAHRTRFNSPPEASASR